MGDVNEGRWSASIDGDLVVFLIGMRVNRPWRPDKWVPVAKAMGPMQAELRETPELGCLHIETGSAGRRSRCSTGPTSSG